MGLDFPIEIEGIHNAKAILNTPVDGPNAVVIPDYDIEADMALAELGFQTSPVVRLVLEWSQGIPRFLMSEDNLTTFLEAIDEQGLETGMKKLGLDKRSFGKILSEAAEFVLQTEGEPVRDMVDPANFFCIVFDELDSPSFLNWDEDVIWDYADIADESGDYDLFVKLEQLTQHTLASYHIGSPECDKQDDVSYRCSVDMEVHVLYDEPRERWTLTGTAAFRDANLENWSVELDINSAYPEMTQDLLGAMGEDTNWEDVLDYETRDCVEEPELPSTSWDGNYAVFINGHLLHRYDDSSDALRFLEMSMETIDREGLGDSVEAYQLSPDAYPEDDDFDEDDQNNWDLI